MRQYSLIQSERPAIERAYKELKTSLQHARAVNADHVDALQETISILEVAFPFLLPDRDFKITVSCSIFMRAKTITEAEEKMGALDYGFLHPDMQTYEELEWQIDESY